LYLFLEKNIYDVKNKIAHKIQMRMLTMLGNIRIVSDVALECTLSFNLLSSILNQNHRGQIQMRIE